MRTQDYIERENNVVASIYTPLPVVLVKGEGVWLWDMEGKKYLDMMSAYSAVSFGHAHPRLIKKLTEQANILSLVSRAFYTDRLAPLLEKVCSLSGLDMGIPMNTGAEAVETALKAARLWGYQTKGIAENQAEIIVANQNFHGRTITIISFSSISEYRKDFGPFTPGFKSIPFGDVQALQRAITPRTCAFLVEPIQGEAGIVVPPQGWLKDIRDVCTENDVLLILDEVQSGLGRTGKTFAFQHENILPDGLILGKALGGGILPISLFLARKEILSHFKPGSHGSTFGGNPLACAVAYEALCLLEEEGLAQRSAELGSYMLSKIKNIKSPLIKDVRGKGLWIGVELDGNHISAENVCKKMLSKGVLAKDTHKTCIRFAPPLIITQNEIDFALNIFESILEENIK